MRDRMLAGEPYIADDPVLAEESRRAQRLTHRLNTADPNDHDLRRRLLTELLGGFGEDSEVRPPFRCDYGYQTTIGARTFVNWGLVSLDVATVTIGDDVQIGPGVQLLTATHPIEPGHGETSGRRPSPSSSATTCGSAAASSSAPASPSARTPSSARARSSCRTCRPRWWPWGRPPR